jgi:hypothetical protein
MKVIEIPNGRLGNGLFRYLAALVFRLEYGAEREHFQNRGKAMADAAAAAAVVITIRDDDFINWAAAAETQHPPSLPQNAVCIFDGYFQQDVYRKYREQILAHLKTHTHEIIYGTTPQFQLIQNTVRELVFAPANLKKYDTVIHVRLEDFLYNNNIVHPRTLDHILQSSGFAAATAACAGGTTTLLCNKPTKDIEKKYVDYFCSRYNITCESNDVITDYHIMKNARVLVCSLSTLSWCAALLSETAEIVYVPKNKTSIHQLFLEPTDNSVVYDNELCGEKELHAFFAGMK